MRTNLLVLAAAALFAFGCAKKPEAKDVSTTPLTSAKSKRLVNVDDDIMRLCSIHIDNVDRAPKFDFDDVELLPEDRDVLEQVARCVTTGPLKGRKLALVGRADARGDTEYNMVLGEHRAESVGAYLANLGVEPNNVMKTSRGELDAEGKDEDSWRRDRRVDVLLLKEEPVASNE
jgi:peptidoglycan-associated lipoprotein